MNVKLKKRIPMSVVDIYQKVFANRTKREHYKESLMLAWLMTEVEGIDSRVVAIEADKTPITPFDGPL